MARVEFDAVRKLYDEDVVAVQHFDLEIEDGEFLTIVGPSGSGKSTLLRMLAGLEEISDGDVRIGGDRVNDIPPRNRGVAMVFQNYALYPHMTVRKNMSYGLKLTSDLDKGEIAARVEEAAEMMGIEELLDQKPGQLSGGQQQRVATGRAIVREPEVFLMDEPLSNLDAKLRTHMRIELQRLQKELETTTIYVTHDQEEALTMSDRIVILDQGELQQVGTPEDVYERPANRFVAEFIGSPAMNIYEGALDGNMFVTDAFEYSLPDSIVDRLNETCTDDQLAFGVRPEDIDLSEARSERSITACINVIEPVGSDKYVYLQTDGSEWTVRVPADTDVVEDSRVEMTFDPGNVHFFDRRTGENLLVDPPTSSAVEQVPK